MCLDNSQVSSETLNVSGLTQVLSKTLSDSGLSHQQAEVDTSVE